MAFKSKYRPKNTKKYIGDITKIICRSSWERALAKYLDENSAVVHWAMEEVIIPYYDPVKQKRRKYYMDFFIEWSDGRRYIVEVKPDKQTKKPRRPKTKRTRRYLREVFRYETNIAKWKAAKVFAEKHSLVFEIWTEHTLKRMGIPLYAGNKKPL